MRILFLILIFLTVLETKGQDTILDYHFVQEELDYDWFNWNRNYSSKRYKWKGQHYKYNVKDSTNSYIQFEIIKLNDSIFQYFEFDSSLIVISSGKMTVDLDSIEESHIDIFDEYGDIIGSEIVFKNPVYRNGKWLFSQGKIKVTGEYDYGKKEGKWKYESANGYYLLEYLENYNNGVLLNTDTINKVLYKSSVKISEFIKLSSWVLIQSGGRYYLELSDSTDVTALVFGNKKIKIVYNEKFVKESGTLISLNDVEFDSYLDNNTSSSLNQAFLKNAKWEIIDKNLVLNYDGKIVEYQIDYFSDTSLILTESK